MISASSRLASFLRISVCSSHIRLLNNSSVLQAPRMSSSAGDDKSAKTTHPLEVNKQIAAMKVFSSPLLSDDLHFCTYYFLQRKQ